MTGMTQRDYGQIQRVLFITFLLNLLATGIKLSVGLWVSSLSLIADGLDNLFDGVSNVVGILAVRVSRRPPDKEHPYGHRKFETLAALFIAAALFITAWELANSAIDRLIHATPFELNYWSFAALIAGSAVQGITGLWELRKARQLASELLMADARHTLASLAVSGAVLVGLGLVWLGYGWADPLVALIVAAFIVKVGVDIVRENVPALVDRAPLDATHIGEVVAGVEGVESFHRIRSRGPADNVAIDLHVRVAPQLSMQDANAIADEVRRRLLALPGVGDVTIHAEAERGPESSADLYTTTKLIAQELDITLHEYWVQSVDDKLSMHLHVGVDPNLSLNDAHDLVDQLEQTLLERRPELVSVHSHIELASPEILPTARVSSGLQQRIQTAVTQAAETVPALTDPHNLQIRQMEGKLFIALEALVDGTMSVTDAHELSTQFQEAIRSAIPNVGEVLIHLEPREP